MHWQVIIAFQVKSPSKILGYSAGKEKQGERDSREYRRVAHTIYTSQAPSVSSKCECHTVRFSPTLVKTLVTMSADGPILSLRLSEQASHWHWSEPTIAWMIV